MDEYSFINGAKKGYGYLKSIYSKYFDLQSEIHILEIGNFCLDHTLYLQDTFPNAKITSFDDMGNVINTERNFIHIWKEHFKKIKKNTDIILGTFQHSHNIKSYYDLVIIDVGTEIENIIAILEKIESYKHIFLLSSEATDEKQKIRNMVINYLDNKKYNYELLNTPWIHIHD